MKEGWKEKKLWLPDCPCLLCHHFQLQCLEVTWVRKDMTGLLDHRTGRILLVFLLYYSRRTLHFWHVWSADMCGAWVRGVFIPVMLRYQLDVLQCIYQEIPRFRAQSHKTAHTSTSDANHKSQIVTWASDKLAINWVFHKPLLGSTICWKGSQNSGKHLHLPVYSKRIWWKIQMNIQMKKKCRATSRRVPSKGLSVTME